MKERLWYIHVYVLIMQSFISRISVPSYCSLELVLSLMVPLLFHFVPYFLQ